MTAIMGEGLFVGIGISNIFTTAKQDSWMVPILSLFMMLFPILILIYILKYKPDLNIFEKNKCLFGNIIGSIINAILMLYALFMVCVCIWTTTSFVITIYLTKTPDIVISLVYVIPAVYAVIKGIETIGRTNELLFFISVFILGTIFISLTSQFNLDFLKPTLGNGVMPIIKGTMLFSSYSFMPLLLVTAIPKNSIVNQNKYWKNLIYGILASMFLMFLVYTLIPGVLSAKLTEIYRFPAYYVQRRISIGDAINNVENFFSIHWLFNTYALITMGIYFIKTYVKDLFKIKKYNVINIVIIAIGLIAIILQKLIFKLSIAVLSFMKKEFLYIALSMVIVLLIIAMVIFIKNIYNKKRIIIKPY
jgi:spore germination protein KB